MAPLVITRADVQHGVAGRPIEHLVAEVSGDDNADLTDSLRRLLHLEVDAITLGNVSPNLGLAAISLAAEGGTPLIHSMVSPSIAEHVHDNPSTLGQTFQVCATETAYMSGFLRTLDLLVETKQWRPPNRRIVVLARSADAQNLLPVAADLAVAGRWELDEFVAINDVGVPWQDIGCVILRSDPAAVFVCTYIEQELQNFLRVVKSAPINPLLFTVWTPSIPDFARRMGELAEGLLWSTVIGTYDDPISEPFLNWFRQAFGEDAGSGSAAIHYDMVHLLATTWSGLDRPWDFDAVVRELRQRVYRGVAGEHVPSSVELRWRPRDRQAAVLV